MKPIFLITLPLVFLLYACPVDTTYPPGIPGTVKFDKSLIGNWTITNKEDNEALTSFSISVVDDFSCSIQVTEKGVNYAADTTLFTGWVTNIDGQQMIYMKSVLGEKYYTYAYKLTDSNTLQLFVIGLLVGGTDAITSTQAYIEEIRGSLKKNDCLVPEGVFNRK